MSWESFYNFLHIKDFIYFISSPQIQDMLFPVRVFFIFCAAFFFVVMIYLVINSSWLQYKFLEDVTEFFLWSAYGQRELEKQWNKIKKRIESGADSDYKLAIIDADDILQEVLDDRGFEGDTFEDLVKKAGRLIGPILDEVLLAHQARNSIVYNPDYKLDADQAKKFLDIYEKAAKSVGV